MHAFEILALALLATPTAAHGVVTLIRGANGVDMPGLSGKLLFSHSSIQY
jgi:hypothetical protein